MGKMLVLSDMIFKTDIPIGSKGNEQGERKPLKTVEGLIELP